MVLGSFLWWVYSHIAIAKVEHRIDKGKVQLAQLTEELAQMRSDACYLSKLDDCRSYDDEELVDLATLQLAKANRLVVIDSILQTHTVALDSFLFGVYKKFGVHETNRGTLLPSEERKLHEFKPSSRILREDLKRSVPSIERGVKKDAQDREYKDEVADYVVSEFGVSPEQAMALVEELYKYFLLNAAYYDAIAAKD